MQAIITKYLGPTNHRGSRVKVDSEAFSATYPWDHALSPRENHIKAARMFVAQRGWFGKWIMGGQSNGYVFVTEDNQDSFEVK